MTSTYKIENLWIGKHSILAKLNNTQPTNLSINSLKFTMTASNQILRLKIRDWEESLYEIDKKIVPSPLEIEEELEPFMDIGDIECKIGIFTVMLIAHPFNIIIERGGQTVFNTCSEDKDHNSIKFEKQNIRISTKLYWNSHLYGLGERGLPFHLPASDQKMALFARDCWSNGTENSYSAHPVYMEMREGKAFGGFLRNSNAMDVSLTKTNLTFEITGGIIDFYFYSGMTPIDIIRQHTSVIGLPFFPPRWSLGYHQCRYGYKSIQEIQTVMENFKNNEIPLETIWIDIDYMQNCSVFTFDEEKFNIKKIMDFSNQIHEKKQKLVVILEPGIPIKKDYAPYTHGLEKDIFVKNENNENVIGEVWPGKTVFIDFMNPKSKEYWNFFVDWLHSKIQVDGLWIDMNEPSNFLNGEGVEYRDNLNNPPYKINNANRTEPLYYKTLPMNSIHHKGLKEYNVHNLYGISQSIVTYEVIKEVKQKRPFIISRSTFPGSGAYCGHWSGDNHSNWHHLAMSIPNMLSFQLFAIPIIGADIGGFNGETDEELMIRWMQLGSFYPFARNHNAINMRGQEPYLWPSVLETSKKYLTMRNSLISLWYTIAYKSSKFGLPIIYSLFFEYPEIEELYWVDWQFLLGGVLLVVPVVQQNSKSVNGYFPPGNWYNYETWELTKMENQGRYLDIAAPLNIMPVFIRGGKSFFSQKGEVLIEDTVKNSYTLTIALDLEMKSTGDFFCDDGDSFVNDETSTFFVVNAELNGENEFLKIRSTGRFNYMIAAKLNNICLLGDFKNEIEEVWVDGIKDTSVEIVKKEFNGNLVGFVLDNLSVSMNKEFSIELK